jgi:predicted NAD/FAD-binding protein
MNVRPHFDPPSIRQRIAVVGTGISGLSAAWLLAKRHDVTLIEAERRLGGHSHTVEAGGVPVDTGFIVYNETTYPNLTALFAHLEVATKPADMSLAVSLDGGRLEYSGHGLRGLFAQPTNAVSPRFWSMLRDLVAFYRAAPRDLPTLGEESLASYLDRSGFGQAFRDDHLYPMAAAIWSTPAAEIGAFPAASFVRFCENHGLLRFVGRPLWRTVDGGSRRYVARIVEDFDGRVSLGRAAAAIRRGGEGVTVIDRDGARERFDAVVIATHADQALRLLERPTEAEARVLGAFGYTDNTAILHADPRLMPRRRATWAAWNYLCDGSRDARRLSVTYWMNRLQGIPMTHPLYVTLNPFRAPDPERVHRVQHFRHPRFDAAAMAAQRRLWSLQGTRGVWYAGAYFGSGFHEDGLQAGLAVAEALGGVRRPWSVAGESGRIVLTAPAPLMEAAE